MTTINVKDAGGATVALEKPLVPGQTTMAGSRPVVIASDQTQFPVNVVGTTTVAGTLAATQSGAWVVRNQDGSGNSLTSATRGTERALSVQIVDSSGNQITTFGGAGGTSSNIGSAYPAQATAAGVKSGANMTFLEVGAAGTPAVNALSVQGLSAGTPINTVLNNGTNAAAIKAGSTPPVTGDPALVVAMSPNSQNANGQAAMANSSPIVIASDQTSVRTIAGGFEYQAVAASSTDQVLGASGGIGDYLEGVLCVVAAAATSQVQIRDGAGGTLRTVLPNGVGAGIGSYYVPLGIKATSAGWRLTTASGVSAIATGDFT